MNDTTDTRAGNWSRYWASGVLHSCPGTFPGNYEGSIRRFWEEALAVVPADGNMLDLCTGNAAVPKLAVETFPTRGFRIDAVDIADVRPAWLSADPSAAARVRIQGGIDVTALPFGDGTFDLVSSQFGIEYTDLPVTLGEVRRVLKPGGTLAWITHTPGSLPLRQAREEYAHLQWIRRRGGVLDAAARLLPYMALAGTDAGRAKLAADPAAAAARESLNQVLRELGARADVSPCPDVLHETADAVLSILDQARQTGDAPACAERLEELAIMLGDSGFRLHELLACARDERAVRDLLSRGFDDVRVFPLPLALAPPELFALAVMARHQ